MIDNLHVKRNKVDVFSHVESSLYLFHVMPILYYTMLFPDVTVYGAREQIYKHFTAINQIF